jgi:ethanolamine utilization microcompartment shell protein EutL
MNSITIAEIKRGGMAALDAALNTPQQGGIVTIMKRNRPAAIVLTPVAYQALLATTAETKPAGSALDWMIAAPSGTTRALDAAAMAQRLGDLRDEWPER